MKIHWLIFTALACAAFPSQAFPYDSFLYQPETGIPGDYLVKLGTAGEPFLIGRLQNEAYSKFHPGLAAELAKLGGRETPNQRIAEALNRYSKNVVKRGDFSSSSKLDVCHALWTIGQRGGPRGLSLLSDWLINNSAPKRKRFAPYIDDLILECAIRGVGWSPEPTAGELLTKLQKSPQQAFDAERFAGHLQSAMNLNQRILREGIKSLLYPPDQASERIP